MLPGMVSRVPVLSLLILAACQDYEIKPATGGDGLEDVPLIRVTPPLLEFGGLAEGEQGEQSFTVHNDGEATLTVSALGVRGAGYSLVDAPTSFDLEPGEERDVDVSFVATGPGDLVGDVAVTSNDPVTPVTTLDLTGIGLMPALVFEPSPYSFGGLWPGCARDTNIHVRNDGYAPLHLDTLLLIGDGFTQLSGPALPLELAIGEETSVDVQFAPLVDGTYDAQIWATSDDPRGALSTALTGVGGDSYVVEQEWTQPDAPEVPVDILLWVDTSGSMDDDAANLAANTTSFTNALTAFDADFQLMVVTKWIGCHNGAFITPETTNPTAEMSSDLSYDAASSGMGEQGLRVSTEAISADLIGPGGCNEGFLREDANLSVLLVSDEPDQSADPWNTYVAALDAAAPGAIISAVAGDVPDGCGEAEPGTGYAEAAAATGGAFLSICDTDWGTHLLTLAEASVGLDRLFPLDAEPVPDSIEVEVDGVAVTTGWVWREDSNTVLFDAESVPGFGQTLVIRYEVAIPPCD
jgi:hypothetical protein